jgi:integrase/recombinase XerD
LNGLLRQAWLQDELATDLYHELTSVSWMRTTTQIGPRRRATGDDLIYLKESCRTDITPNGRRDLALISLLASAACNASELIRLDRKALDLERGTLKITPQSAEIRLDRDTLDTLRDWLQVRGSEPGALFTGIDRTNSGVDLRPLTPSAITWILRKRAHQAGVPYLSSEDLRRSSILERYFSNPSATAQSQR